MIKIDENLTVTSPVGFKASGIHCGLKKSLLKKDLALIYSDVVATSCGVYTKNKVKGAPLTITKQHLINKKAQAIIINSGNANTCNGDDGLSKAKKMTHLCAKALSIKNDDVLVASTGVIGVPLNIDAIKNGIPQLVGNLSSDIEGAKNASMAIMTTDTVEKQAGIQLNIGGKKVTLAAMAKGSGMIHPNMATMLSFITTDISISPSLLKEALKEAFKYDNKVIIEENVDGFEVGCAVLGTDKLIIGEVDEIELEDGFFDYFEKYNLKTSKIHLPARISKEERERIKDTALAIYKILGCSGFARVDMFYTKDKKIVFNEVNTIPGCTSHSRYPSMLKKIGIPFEEVIDRLIELGWDK